MQFVDGRHPLSLRIERRLGNPWKDSFQIGLGDSETCGGLDERAFGWVADRLERWNRARDVLTALPRRIGFQLGIVAQAAD